MAQGHYAGRFLELLPLMFRVCIKPSGIRAPGEHGRRASSRQAKEPRPLGVASSLGDSVHVSQLDRKDHEQDQCGLAPRAVPTAWGLPAPLCAPDSISTPQFMSLGAKSVLHTPYHTFLTLLYA